MWPKPTAAKGSTNLFSCSQFGGGEWRRGGDEEGEKGYPSTQRKVKVQQTKPHNWNMLHAMERVDIKKINISMLLYKQLSRHRNTQHRNESAG